MVRNYKSKAMRLTDEFLRDIWNNSYARDCHLPAEETLAVRYKCSRMTIRKVLANLAADGVLVKIPGCGTRINPHLDLPAPPCPDHCSNKSIAAVMAAFPDILTIEVNRGIHDYALQHGISFTLLQNTEGPAALAQNLKNLNTTELSGIIWLGADPLCNTQIRALSKRGFPVVCADNPIPESSIPYIGVDNFGGMYTATAQQLNHYKKVYYLGHREERHSQQERYRGYCAAMKDYGLENQIEKCTITIPLAQDSGKYLDPESERRRREAAGKLFTFPLPFGVVAECDYIAHSILKTAEALHLVPGKDFSIIGFDDLPQAAQMDLSSIRQPRYELGYEAARLLDQLIGGQQAEYMAKLLPVTMKLRKSSGN